jgi:hypothetical protein
MAVERIEWTCPGCERRYAIPSNAPKPALCPSCQSSQKSADVAPNPAAPSSQGSAPALPPARNKEPEPIVEVSPFDRLAELDTGPRRSVSRGTKRYPALRAIAFWYRILAGLAGLGAIIGLIYALLSAVSDSTAAERTTHIILGLASFGSGVVGGVTLLAFGELIQVVIDIEENTRGK